MRKHESHFAESLGRAHGALLKDLRALQEAACSASNRNPELLRSRLEATRRHIVEHFRFEEQDGYMDTVRHREPRLGHSIDELAKEHGQLLNEMDVLLTEVAVASTINESLSMKVSEWINHVRQHETRENHLVQDAFNLDIGLED
jgi:hypothetical protein